MVILKGGDAFRSSLHTFIILLTRIAPPLRVQNILQSLK